MLEVKDATLPDYDSIFKNCGQAIQIFNGVMEAICPPVQEAPFKAKAVPKRKKEPENGNQAVEYDEEVKTAIAGLLSKYKVADLVAVLKASNQPIKSRKKADLLEAIEELYSKAP